MIDGDTIRLASNSIFYVWWSECTRQYRKLIGFYCFWFLLTDLARLTYKFDFGLNSRISINRYRSRSKSQRKKSISMKKNRFIVISCARINMRMVSVNGFSDFERSVMKSIGMQKILSMRLIEEALRCDWLISITLAAWIGDC